MKGYVSLWMGNFFTEKEFENYVSIDYTADGDSIPSQFEKDFNLGRYNRDLIEKDWIAVSENNISNLLEDFTYDNQLIPQFNFVDKEYNTIILIYSYNYEQESIQMRSLKEEVFELNFIGVAKYLEE